VRLDLSYNVPHAAMQPVVRSSSADTAAHARNCAVVWLAVRPESSDPMLLGLLYFHPSADRRDFDSCAASIRAAVATDIPVFLQGDFNEHCQEWGDARAAPSRFAAQFAALFDALSLDVLNPAFPDAAGVATRPDFAVADSGAVIDLAVSSQQHMVDSLRVLHAADTGLVSDHCSLLLTIQCSSAAASTTSAAAEPSARRTFNYHKADWQIFHDACSRFLSESRAARLFQQLRACPAAVNPSASTPCACVGNPADSLQAAWQAFREALVDSANCSIPERRLCRYSKSWWNWPGGDLTSAYRSFRQALAAHTRVPSSIPARRDLAECRFTWRRMLREAKCWQQDQRCNELQKDPQAALNWQAYLRHTGQKSADASALKSVVSPADGSLPSSPLHAADNLAEHFRLTCHLPPLQQRGAAAPHGSPAEHHQNVLRWLQEEGARTAAHSSKHSELNALFTLPELRDHLDSLRPKAEGADSISTLFLQRGGRTVQETLLLLFNYSWAHGCMPLDWRSAEVLPLYKGKGERSDANNYRPISLTSCAVRCLEGLIHQRLYPLAERLGMLSPMQFGFRHRRGTVDALFSLTEWVKSTLSCKGPASALAAFLDLAKAYDRTWQDGVLYRLAHGAHDGASEGIAGRAWAWIRAFLTGRRFRVRAGRCHSVWKFITASVPQGAVLSPLLFAIFLDPLLRALLAPDLRRSIPGESGVHAVIHAQLFADDAMLGANTRCSDWENVFQLALNRCDDFALRWRLCFSTAAGKSALVHFRRSNAAAATHTPAFQLSGSTLQQQESFKFLGVMLHERLSWKPHFELLLRRGRFAAFQLQRMIPTLLGKANTSSAHSTGGPHFRAVRALLLGAVYSRISYGIQFISGTGVNSMMDRLESIAVRPLRVALALPGSTPTKSLLIEADIPTMQLFRQQLLLSFAARTLRQSADHPSRLLLEQSWQQLLRVNTLCARRACPASHPWYYHMASYAVESRRPLLYDVLEAEIRWGVQLLPHKPSAAKLLPSPNAALTCTQIEEKYGAPSLAATQAADATTLPPIAASNAALFAASTAALFGSSGGAASLACVADNSRFNASLLARKRSFSEWVHDGRGSPLLRQLKTRPGRSQYLYMEPRGSAILRARLRFNRATLAASMARRGDACSPLCTLTAECRQNQHHQTVEHVLLFCPALQLQRRRCTMQLQRLHNIPFSLAGLLSGPTITKDRAEAAAEERDKQRAAVPIAAPVPVFFPGGYAAPALAVTAAAAFQRQPNAEQRIARAALYITSSFLRAVQAAAGGML